MHCANVFTMGSSNSSFSTIPCTRAAIAYLAAITSLGMGCTLWRSVHPMHLRERREVSRDQIKPYLV